MKDTFDYSALGKRIRKARKQQGLTQEQLAEACNLSTAHIGHIERGTRALSIESLVTLSQHLHVSTDYLLLDISNSATRDLSTLVHALDNIEDEKYKKLYNILKILTENIENL